MKSLQLTMLHNPKLLSHASKLDPIGYTAVSEDNLSYLDLDDTFVHTLYPLLQDDLIRKPNYFLPNFIGAHISIIYPDENKVLKEEDVNKMHSFHVKGAYTGVINSKQYFVITVESESLRKLRNKYHLPNQPCFKEHYVDFHITIGVL